MPLHKNIISFLKSTWFISIVILLIFFATTGYKFAWDDQHLEITLLKSLIDNSLYPGDYYVEGLKGHFTSFLYPILAKIITVAQIPITYFILYIISRYFLFFWIYKLWFFISKDKFKAFYCVLVFILMTRVNEFLYRTFSHQEFALAIIFAGIYYFFKERFYLAALLLGIAANFHALYSLFPMIFMCSYLLWQIKKHGFAKLINSSLIFILACMPFLIWMTKIHIAGSSQVISHENWQNLYKLACPQNFMFPPNVPLFIIFKDIQTALTAAHSYIIIILLFLMNLFFNKDFSHNKKAVVFCLTAFFLLFISLIFTYFYPTRFILDLNLIRNTQFITFIIMGFTTLFIFNLINTKNNLQAFLFAILFILLKYDDRIAILSIIILTDLLIFNIGMKKGKTIKYIFLGASLLIIPSCLIGIHYYFNIITYKFETLLFFFIIVILTSLNYFIFYILKTDKQKMIQKLSYLIIPMFIFIIQFRYYNVKRIHEEKSGGGFWQLQRSWEDMQRFVKENTPKDAVILVPYNMEMGGFRILSERKIVASYRDCGIIGFNYPTAVEWKKRIDNISAFKVGMSGNIGRALKNAVIKYGADYIVFQRYAMPNNNSHFLDKIYINMDFALYKVTPNPSIKR